MGQIAKRVEDKRLRKLIRAFLNAGVMESVARFITHKLKEEAIQAIGTFSHQHGYIRPPFHAAFL